MGLSACLPARRCAPGSDVEEVFLCGSFQAVEHSLGARSVPSWFGNQLKGSSVLLLPLFSVVFSFSVLIYLTVFKLIVCHLSASLVGGQSMGYEPLNKCCLVMTTVSCSILCVNTDLEHLLLSPTETDNSLIQGQFYLEARTNFQ